MQGLWGHGAEIRSSRGRRMVREGWEVRVFVNWVFIVFLGFELASWFPGQEVARDGGERT
jgi:hypothetical protein